MGESIVIRGARVHNLKNLTLELPHYHLTVVTGVSGSGKSSLVFDISSPKASAATSNRSPPTPASFWTAWKSPMSTKSKASRRPSPFARKTPRATHAPPSPRPPSSTTTCACCGRAPAAPFAPRARRKSSATRSIAWLRASWSSPPVRAGMRSFLSPPV